MILGLNTDVRHRGKTFHIQTEDSGPNNPVLLTHVFLGGTIVGTRKRAYAEAVGKEPDLEAFVRGLMRQQHKEAYEALLAGEYDEVSTRPARSGDIPLARKTHRAPPPSELAVTTPAPELIEIIEERRPEEPRPPTEELTRRPALPTGSLPPPLPVFGRQGPPPLPAAVTTSAPPALPAPSVPPAIPQAMPVIPQARPEPPARIEFPTELTARRPLDAELLAYLLEDQDPR